MEQGFPFMLVPPMPDGRNGFNVLNTNAGNFDISQAISSLSSSANNWSGFVSSVRSPGATQPGTSASAGPNFRPPAHKHAHHLHSIPPREKSTRTLIIDHLLWVHGRTRLSQARAELGMTDRTGGPSSQNYTHRHRPENYDEDQEVDSEGEDTGSLKARSEDVSGTQDEEDKLKGQDLKLSSELRLRAISVEKVINSMLDQPPPIHPTDEDFWTPPNSPQITNNDKNPHPHTLPNGVRLRLALGTIINDFFARQAPHPPQRHKQHNHTQSTTETSPICGTGSLPQALEALSLISAYSPRGPQDAPSTNVPIHPSLRQNAQHIAPRVLEFYRTGADPDTANSPPALRCPRHLHTGCDICVEAKTAYRPPVRRTSTHKGNAFRPGQTSSPDSVGITGWKDGSGIGSGLATPPIGGNVLRRRNPVIHHRTHSNGSHNKESSEDLCSGGGNTKLSELMVRFLRLSALVAYELGLEIKDDEEAQIENARIPPPIVSPDEDVPMANVRMDTNRAMTGLTPSTLSELTPLSDALSPGSVGTMGASTPVPTSTDIPKGAETSKEAATEHRMYKYALRPSLAWYMLLAGLLTRAVLEGYLTAGWRDSDAVACLLTLGQGFQEPSPRADVESSETSSSEDDQDEFAEFDPDELPSLVDSVKILFPSLKFPDQRKGEAEEEFGREMRDRMKKFYDIPPSTPDLSTHMEDLAWQYPAEPVERAAVRFCEAVARWRGLPELETYKKKPHQPTASNRTNIENLIHPTSNLPMNPSLGGPLSPQGPQFGSVKPSIDRYFIIPTSEMERTATHLENNTGDMVDFSRQQMNGNIGWNWFNLASKRPRSPVDARSPSGPKRVHI